MRKTYAYNGIILGFVLGLAAWAYTENTAIGIAAGIASAIIIFIIIRSIENGIYKAGDAITRRLDDMHTKK
ncbi:MAG: hypothetical protein MJ172_09440 [Clostridia bacterium]|nr:hypothetical protein [Clostridia bacterium]